MKKNFRLIIALLLIEACTSQFNNLEVIDDNRVASVETKADIQGPRIDFNLGDLDTQYFVSDEDIKSYLHFKKVSGNNNPPIVVDVELFEFQGATLLYIINYQEGWEVISADKRTPYLLAKGSSNSMTMKKYSDTPWGNWLFTVAIDVLRTRLYGQETTYESNDNLRFWKLITEPESVIGMPLLRKQEEGIRLNPDGHYELTDTFVQPMADSVCIQHLTVTRWNQSDNEYVPLKSIPVNNTYDRAPAGCVAVAGAQMLYFLHYEWGVPQNAPNYAYCSGNVDNYSMGQSGSSSTIWNTMATSYDNEPAWILIANVGTRVNMSYGNNGSSANTSDLVDNVFVDNGISCEYDSYDVDEIRTSLINNHVPLVVRANVIDPFGAWFAGHSFLIDKCVYYRNRITYTYTWVYDTPPGGGIVPEPPQPYTVTTYTYHSMGFVGMNWGWGNVEIDSMFSPGGDWEVHPDNTYHLNYLRHMIHNFAVIN